MPKKNSLTAELNKPFVRPLMDDPDKQDNNSKTSVSKPTPPPLLSKVQDISLNLITPNKTNPRKTYSKENIKEMAESMAPPVGLLQPITLRPLADGFEIVFGWRRYMAATALKWKTIPAIVKYYTDEQMLEFQLIEYLQREDISPLDEAHSFKDLLKKESIDWLAARIYKTKKYISDRLKLNDLVPEATDYLAKGILPLGHAVVISKMSYADQKACLTKCIDDGFNHDVTYCKLALEDLKEFIADDIMLEFTRASFNTEDPLLYPAAGPCTTCPKRTSNSNLLFNDITSADKCTDAACFNEKIKLNVEAAKEKGKKEYGKVLSGEKNSYGSRNEIKVQGVSVPIQAKPNKNSIPVVITKVNSFSGKNEVGTTVYVDKNKVDLVKHEKEEKKLEKKTVTKTENYEERKLRLLKENWPRIEFIVNNNLPVAKIIKEYFRDMFERLPDRAVFAFASIAKIIPEALTPEQAIEKEDDKQESRPIIPVVEKIIDHYTPERLIMIIMMLREFDKNREIDHEEENGFSWDELVKEISPVNEKSKTGKSLTGKK